MAADERLLNKYQIGVWAPFAQEVRVQIAETTHLMVQDQRGWWRFEAREDLAGLDYAFLVDGSSPFPDPRSLSQPYGVHGRSRFIDHSSFQWTDAEWNAPPLGSGVIYELHIGTFTPEGTFDGAIARLDHLVNLGVSHVEVMPVAEFPGDRGWGYDGVDLYAPHHAYGGPEGLKRFVNASHERGLAVLLDVVYNHFGPDGNYLSQFGPYFSDRHKTPWGDSVNLDGDGSVEVRRFLIDNALMWLRDYHFDGLRLDAVHALFDYSVTHFLEQLAREVEEFASQSGRNLVLVAESDWNDPKVVQPRKSGGYGLTAQWSDDFHHALHACLTGETAGYYSDFGQIEQVKKALESGFVYDGVYSSYRNRNHGLSAVGVPLDRFVICLQNHDQIGNRAQGERSSQLMSVDGLLAGAAVLLTAASIPLLFQGEEWGASTPFQYFTAHQDERIAKAVSEGRKKEFGSFNWRTDNVPDPQSVSTFARSKLDWDELNREPHRTVLKWHRALIELRRSLPALGNGRPYAVNTECGSTLRVDRGSLLVKCSFDSEAPSVEVSVSGRVLLRSGYDR